MLRPTQGMKKGRVVVVRLSRPNERPLPLSAGRITELALSISCLARRRPPRQNPARQILQMVVTLLLTLREGPHFFARLSTPMSQVGDLQWGQ
jgi:hypothetical protein